MHSHANHDLYCIRPSEATLPLLDYLNASSVNATFCVVGSRIKERPHILEKIHQQGHHLCIHTWSHPALTTLSNEQIIAELEWTRRIITTITGVSPTYLRPPYGKLKLISRRY